MASIREDKLKGLKEHILLYKIIEPCCQVNKYLKGDNK